MIDGLVTLVIGLSAVWVVFSNYEEVWGWPRIFR